jgi:hypothetical protein
VEVEEHRVDLAARLMRRVTGRNVGIRHASTLPSAADAPVGNRRASNCHMHELAWGS